MKAAAQKIRLALFAEMASLRLAAANLVRAGFWSGLVSILAFSLLGYLGSVYWLFDLANHFRLQYWWGALLGLVVTVILRKWIWVAAALACLILNSIYIFPWISVAGTSVVKVGGQRIKLVQSNVLYNNARYDEVIAYLKDEAPDIAVLQEVTSTWAQQLEPLKAFFPAHHIEPQAYGTGIALYSRHKFIKAETLDLCVGCRRTILAQIQIGTTPVNVLTIHPPTPTSASGAADRNRQFEAVAAYLNRLPAPKILIGDFNDTVWSTSHARLLQQSQLINVRKGRGLWSSWPSWLRLAPFMIPIDHCLISSDLTVVSVRTGKNIGSDHLPFIVEVKMPQQK